MNYQVLPIPVDPVTSETMAPVVTIMPEPLPAAVEFVIGFAFVATVTLFGLLIMQWFKGK